MQERVPISRYWLVVVISIAMAIGLNNVLLFLNIAQYSEAYQKAAEALYAPPFTEQILLYGIFIPVIEEILFRGIIFKWLRGKIPFVWAMLISAVLFGAYHGNVVQFVYAGSMGMMLAWLYEKYQCIAAPVLSHIVMNVIVSILAEMNMFAWMLETPMRVVISTSLCVIVAGAVFLLIQKMDVTKLLKKYCKHTGDVI